MAFTCSAVALAGRATAPASTACSAEPIAADMVCEPAKMPPAAPTGRSWLASLKATC